MKCSSKLLQVVASAPREAVCIECDACQWSTRTCCPGLFEQVDAPEDAEGYIHRVGRTARYNVSREHRELR